jgi:hypothetical protein
LAAIGAEVVGDIVDVDNRYILGGVSQGCIATEVIVFVIAYLGASRMDGKTASSGKAQQDGRFDQCCEEHDCNEIDNISDVLVL